MSEAGYRRRARRWLIAAGIVAVLTLLPIGVALALQASGAHHFGDNTEETRQLTMAGLSFLLVFAAIPTLVLLLQGTKNLDRARRLARTGGA